MITFIETRRLLLREIVPADATAFLKLETDPEVHRYLGNRPVQHIEEIEKIIVYVRNQYAENGIGRWAVVEKATGDVVGWAGLKREKATINGRSGFMDVGYRLMKKYWGLGYATEAAVASVNFAFTELNELELIATAHRENLASLQVLAKSGFTKREQFEWNGLPEWWLTQTRGEWAIKNGL